MAFNHVRPNQPFGLMYKKCHLCFILELFCFKGHSASPSHQLSLALIWNRADIAKCEIFKEDRKWEVLSSVFLFCQFLLLVKFYSLLFV